MRSSPVTVVPMDFLPGIPDNSHATIRFFAASASQLGVELVLYAVNNRDPRHAEWRAGASRISPA
jgi:hypothetical protein